ncbi:RICIN domain-containing protein [uncultured Aquimarina sp.]|uniref:RICIN domain-containing protein n=1 Tax=uncultured Aquimarina sp. TaxID=575652 RepID=UPI00261E6EBB|nr:RICIN domain-containing protein [uncultured Aquimarina sp.]
MNCLLFIFIYQSIYSQIYVSKTGNDNNSGTYNSPYRTIQKAANVAQAGQTVTIRAGVYYENVVVKNSGTNENKIIFKGELDNQGKHLTIIDGSKEISGWIRDSRFSNGVYYHTQSIQPNTLVLHQNGDTYDIAKLANFNYPIETIINYNNNHEITTVWNKQTVRYWDGLEALYYYKNGRIYLRFRGNDNPNNKKIRYSTKSGFLIDNKSDIIIKDLKIRASVRGIELYGANTKNNKVDNCYLINGQERVLIVNGAFNNEIANSTMKMQGMPSNYIGGAWGSGNKYIHAVKEHIYNVYKNEVGISRHSPNEDCGIDFVGSDSKDIYGNRYKEGGAGNKIYGNNISESLAAVVMKSTRNTKIYNNVIHNTSSMAFEVHENSFGIEVYDNLFYDINFLSRIQKSNIQKPRRVFFYRNRCWNEPGVGAPFIYAHFDNGENYRGNEIYIYHNSFSGGNTNISSAFSTNLDNYFLVNNIFSNTLGPRNVIKSVGKYDYNWCGGQFTKRDYYGSNNILRSDSKLWSDNTRPDFKLTSNSEAIDAGIDLSKTKINGLLLPGMYPGYFNGNKPDLGAYEFGPSSDKDSLNSINGPDQVSSNNTYSVSIGYTASTDRDIIVSFLEDEAPFTNYGTIRVSVSKGNKFINVAIPINDNIPIATNKYQWSTYIVPKGGNYSNRLDSKAERDIDVIPSANNIIESNYWRLENKETGQWVRPLECAVDTGTKLVVSPIGNTGDCTMFSFKETDFGYYFIINKATNGRLKFKNDSNVANDTVPVELVGSEYGGWNPQWKLIDAGNGYYRIQNRVTGNWIRSKGCSGEENIPITQVSKDFTGDCTKWKLVDAGPIDTSLRATNEAIESSDITVYPNPARNQLFVSGDTKDMASIKIYNLQGRNIKTIDTKILSDQSTMMINTTGLQQGLYVLSIDYLKKDSKSIQFVINN